MSQEARNIICTIHTYYAGETQDRQRFILNVFDLQPLEPTADTSRTFEDILQSADESLLDTNPIDFTSSNGTTSRMEHSILWKACTILFFFPLALWYQWIFYRTRTFKLS